MLNFHMWLESAESTESTESTAQMLLVSVGRSRLACYLLVDVYSLLLKITMFIHVYPVWMDKSTINSYVSFGPSMKVNFFTEIDDEGDQIDDDHVSAAQKCPSIRRRRIDASCSAPEQEDSVFSTCSYTKMHSCRIQRYTKYH